MDPAYIPFSEEDEGKMKSAATWGMIVAITSIIGAGISLIGTASSMADLPEELRKLAMSVMVPGMLIEAFYLTINVFLLQACRAIRKVATTNEADQAYLLAAFRKLRLYFMVQVIMVLVGLGLGFFAMSAGSALLP